MSNKESLRDSINVHPDDDNSTTRTDDPLDSGDLGFADKYNIGSSKELNDPLNAKIGEEALSKDLLDLRVSGTVQNNRTSVWANPEEGLTIFSGILAILSTCVGGGIVGLPFSMYHFGMPLALFLHFVVMFLTNKSCMLYLKTKDLIPDQPESLFEIGYMVMGRKAIFIIATIQVINALGLMMIYFVVFGDTSAQLI